MVAVSSAIAIMSAATISGLAPGGSVEYAALTAALAILAGIVSIAAGVLRLGRIAQFFSESVLLGFVFGLALLITIKQIPKLLGIEAHGESALDLVRRHDPPPPRDGPADAGGRDRRHRGDDRPGATAATGAGGARRAPGLDRGLGRPWASRRAASTWSASSRPGLRGPTLPGVGIEAVPMLLFGAIGIALVAFAEAIGPANEFAREHGGKIDPNRELIAIGAANTGAGLFTGFPIGSSLSKSAANDRAGARTPASLVTAAGCDRPGGPLPDAAVRAAAGGDPRCHRRSWR